ncbi:hypothetical protein IL54_2219 [Sphingobium sp. ba1]|nr:hypothetical protein IL54_2219 [Sphingobium sp. ba1]
MADPPKRARYQRHASVQSSCHSHSLPVPPSHGRVFCTPACPPCAPLLHLPFFAGSLLGRYAH